MLLEHVAQIILLFVILLFIFVVVVIFVSLRRFVPHGNDRLINIILLGTLFSCFLFFVVFLPVYRHLGDIILVQQIQTALNERCGKDVVIADIEGYREDSGLEYWYENEDRHGSRCIFAARAWACRCSS
jgi:hypothetical protein